MAIVILIAVAIALLFVIRWAVGERAKAYYEAEDKLMAQRCELQCKMKGL